MARPAQLSIEGVILAVHLGQSPAEDVAVAESAGPIIVFGTGGSGTRAVAAFLSDCGIDMGERVNGSGDALEFTDLLEENIDSLLQSTRKLDYDIEEIDPELCANIVGEYRQAAKLHRQSLDPAARWGFKNPRHIFTLPLVELVFPRARYVHVVRDGRDMLLSRNRNQPKKHYEALFGRPFARTESDIARFWAKTNMEARAFGTRVLGDRYAIVRIEDLCGAGQVEAVTRLSMELGIEGDTARRAAAAFKAQDTFGRGQSYSSSGPEYEEFDAALREFGYS